MKKCSKCGLEKEYGEFHKHHRYKDGYRSWCTKCERQYYYENKPERQKWSRKYYKRNKSEIRARVKKYYYENIEYLRAYEKKRQWSHHLKYHYGLTIEQFDEMVKKVNGKCEICKKAPKKRLRVDHCHDSGKVRGLLCDWCNWGLHFIEDKFKYRNALKYLKNARYTTS